MLFTEWNMEDALRVTREEGREEGLEEGMEKGILALADFLSPEKIAQKLGVSLEKVQSVLHNGNKQHRYNDYTLGLQAARRQVLLC